MTLHMWHVTCDTYGGGWTFSQNFSSPAFTVWDRQCLEDFKQKGLLNEWINDECVYRIATSVC